MLTAHDRNPARPGFRPMDFDNLPFAPWAKGVRLPRHRRDFLVRLARRHKLPNVSAATQARALLLIEAYFLRHGSRIQLSTTLLGRMLGMSQSTGSRILRGLRQAQLLSVYRDYAVRWSRDRHCWEGQAYIHDLPEWILTNLFETLPEGVSQRP